MGRVQPRSGGDQPTSPNQSATAAAPAKYPLQGRSLVVLRTRGPEEGVPVVASAQTAAVLKEQPQMKQPQLQPVGG